MDLSTRAKNLLNIRLARHHPDQAADTFTYVQGECSECDRIVSIYGDLVSGVTVEVEGELPDAARLPCPEDGCERSFLTKDRLLDHADAVHTFDDIRMAVQSEVREKFGRQGDYRAEPPIPSIYVWVSDLAEDWVVFQIEGDGPDCQLMKAAYTIDDTGDVTIGTPVEVTRRTVYDPVGTNSRAASSTTVKAV